MLNNITLFNAEIRDGLEQKLLGKAGLGPAYTSVAYGPKQKNEQKKLGSWKRATTLHKPSVQKRPITSTTKAEEEGSPTELSGGNLIPLASNDDFISPE